MNIMTLINFQQNEHLMVCAYIYTPYIHSSPTKITNKTRHTVELLGKADEIKRQIRHKNKNL